MTRSMLVRPGDVVISAEATPYLWRWLYDELQRRSRDGGRVRPEVMEAVEALRQATIERAVSDDRTNFSATSDMGSPSSHDEPRSLPTAELAARLRVGERHAKRIAAAAGVEPMDRNRRPLHWHVTDVAALVELRRTS